MIRVTPYLDRPNFRALNPFRWYSNPYSYSTGNPLLQPSYNNNFEIDYLYKSIFSLAFYVQKTDNGFGRLTQIDQKLRFRSRNERAPINFEHSAIEFALAEQVGDGLSGLAARKRRGDGAGINERAARAQGCERASFAPHNFFLCGRIADDSYKHFHLRRHIARI